MAMGDGSNEKDNSRSTLTIVESECSEQSVSPPINTYPNDRETKKVIIPNGEHVRIYKIKKIHTNIKVQRTIQSRTFTKKKEKGRKWFYEMRNC